MFHKLRLQLTTVCALGTTLILMVMAAVSYSFSTDQLRAQYEQRFSSSAQAVYHVLRTQPVIDHAWLLDTEHSANLIIGIQSSEYDLLFTGNDASRQELTELALAVAAAQHGFNPYSQPASLYTTEEIRFRMEADASQYRAAVAQLPVGDHWISVTVLQSLANENHQIRILILKYAVSAILASIGMLAFAWLFTGSAVRPVEASRQKQSAFVAAASHEFRAPLAVIQIGAERIADSPVDKVSSNAIIILRECDRLKRLTEDLLQLAGADNQTWTMRFSPVNPEAIVLNAVDEFLSAASAKNVRLSSRLPEELLPQIHCDKGRMEQVLAILLDNALRFVPDSGRVEVLAQADQNHLCFAVSDDGPGIPDGEKALVFDRFYQGDRSRSGKEHFGLGLSIAKEIIQRHRGEIGVRDSEWGGAQFYIRLPLQ